MRTIHIADARRRDAEVLFSGQSVGPAWRMVLPDGRLPRPVRLLRTTVDRTARALEERYGSPEAVADALVAGDPEVDTEADGRLLRRTRRLWVDGRGGVAYRLDLRVAVYGPDGSLREQRDVNRLPGNLNGEMPVRWTGRFVPVDEAVRRYVFTRNYQIRHINGATFDFLYAMARQLDQRRAMVLVAAGPGGREPLRLSRGGQPYRGLLEGRIDGERYTLLLHLTDLELRGAGR